MISILLRSLCAVFFAALGWLLIDSMPKPKPQQPLTQLSQAPVQNLSQASSPPSSESPPILKPSQLTATDSLEQILDPTKHWSEKVFHLRQLQSRWNDLPKESRKKALDASGFKARHLASKSPKEWAQNLMEQRK